MKPSTKFQNVSKEVESREDLKKPGKVSTQDSTKDHPNSPDKTSSELE